MHDPDDGMAVQTEGALARLTERLEERGCGLEDILSLTCYVNDMAELDEMNGVYAKWMGDVMVCSTKNDDFHTKTDNYMLIK